MDWLQPKSVSSHQLQMKTIVAAITWKKQQQKLVSSNSPLKLSWTEDASWPENVKIYFVGFCMIVLSIFMPRICFIALNLSYSWHSHVGLLSLLRTKIRTKLGLDVTKYKEHTLAVLQWFIFFFSFFFTGWSKTKKGFFSFSQTKPFHNRSEWLDKVTWRMEHQGRSTVFVEMGWFWYVIIKIISQLPVQFWSDQQHFGMWSLLFKLETAKLMCLHHVSHLAQWYVEQTGCIHTLCHYKLFAMVSDFLSFLL